MSMPIAAADLLALLAAIPLAALGAIVMRVLYFLLADVADRFHLLKYGLAMVLTFIGAKMLIMPWYHMPVAASLTIVAVLIVGSIVASLIATRNGHLPKEDAT